MNPTAERRTWSYAVAIVVALTVLRLILVFSTGFTLGAEEAQYWSWSLNPDFGYFSKPPMIAWIIGAMTGVCGDGEGCIRAASPMLYAVAALFIFEAGRVLYGARAAFWCCIAFISLPGTSVSAGLMTTDVPLLAFWSAGLFFLALLLRASPAEGRGAALGLGVSIGLAIMSKYAGAYFLLGLIAAAAVDQRLRAHLAGRNGAVISLAALAIVSPNIWWNLAHGFATFRATASNAVISETPFNLDRVAEFVATQFGLIGPVLFLALVWGLLKRDRTTAWPRIARDDVVLLLVSVPAFIVGSAIALLSKANGNWGATALPGMAMVATVWLLRAPSMRWLTASFAFAGFIGAVVIGLALSPAFVDAVGLSSGLKVLRGWNTHAPEIVRAARETGAEALLSDDREDTAMLLYYTRTSGLPIYTWTPNPELPLDHFQMTRPYSGTPDRVLLVTKRPDPTIVTRHFTDAHEDEVSSVLIGPARRRTFRLIDLSGFKRD